MASELPLMAAEIPVSREIAEDAAEYLRPEKRSVGVAAPLSRCDSPGVFPGGVAIARLAPVRAARPRVPRVSDARRARSFPTSNEAGSG